MFRIRNSLRTVLAVHLVLILVVAKLLTGVVIIRLFQQDAIKTRIAGARVLIHASMESAAALFTEPVSEARLELSGLEKLSRNLGYGTFSIISAEGYFAYPPEDHGRNSVVLETAALSIESGRDELRFSGRTWGILWFAYQTATLAVPLTYENRPLAAVTLEMPLEPIYESLRSRQKAVLLYMGLNVFFLAIFGVYRLGRVMIHPINRLFAATEQFTGEQPFPNLYEEDRSTEIGKVQRSLHAMLKRLEDNKQELKGQLARLEKSNLELREAHREIIISEKLASVGRLATGVAHEIGNPLGIVLGYLEILKTGKLAPQEQRNFLERIEAELTRIHMTIRHLLDFSRPSSGAPGPVSLGTAVKDALSVLELHPMMSSVQVISPIGREHDLVWADPNQLQQVIINIIINAVDAMVDSEERKIFISTQKVDDFIELSVRDTGTGVEEENLGRLFEPFYTTKEPGKGTGMGLAVCYRIIEASCGTIRAFNSEDGGLEIRISYPLYIPGSAS